MRANALRNAQNSEGQRFENKRGDLPDELSNLIVRLTIGRHRAADHYYDPGLAADLSVACDTLRGLWTELEEARGPRRSAG